MEHRYKEVLKEKTSAAGAMGNRYKEVFKEKMFGARGNRVYVQRSS